MRLVSTVGGFERCLVVVVAACVDGKRSVGVFDGRKYSVFVVGVSFFRVLIVFTVSFYGFKQSVFVFAEFFGNFYSVFRGFTTGQQMIFVIFALRYGDFTVHGVIVIRFQR